MSRDLKLHQLLTNIVRVADQSDAHAAEDAVFTDVAAIAQMRSLALKSVEVLTNGEGTPPSESRSSVRIELGTKGEIRCEVKAYTGSPLEPALADASRTWDRLMEELAIRARVAADKEAANAHP